MDQGEWINLTDAALRLGTSTEALRKRIARGKIQASRGNDGHSRVWVTPAMVEEALSLRGGNQDRTRPISSPDRDRNPDRTEVNISGQIKALEAVLNVIREQLAAAEARAERERTERLAVGEGARRREEQLLAELKRTGEGAAAERDRLADQLTRASEATAAATAQLVHQAEAIAAERAGWQEERNRMLEERARLMQVLEHLQRPWWRRWLS